MNSLKFFRFFIITCCFNSPCALSDNFEYNTYNNHGVLGLINIPSARFYSEGSFGITGYNGYPDQKVTMTSSPYDWLEASFFYTNIKNNPKECNFRSCYKDKGFNFKVRIKEEGKFPAIAIGINDIAGTGLYTSEYIVGSYGIKNLDMHFGIGWGALNGLDKHKNPLRFIHDSFNDRPERNDLGGSFNPSWYFSGKMSPFFGISYLVNKNILLKIEKDPTLTPGKIGFDIPESRVSFGFDYLVNKNLSIGLSSERNDHISLRFIFKKKMTQSKNSSYDYKKVSKTQEENKYNHFIKSLESNGIGVNKIVENSKNIGIEITQFIHPNLDIIEEILKTASKDSGLDKEVKVDYRIVDLQAYSDFDEELINNSKLIYQRQKKTNFSSSTSFNIRPFIAAREDFFKASLLLENNIEYVIQDNFIFSSNLKYSIYDNFEDLTIPPRDVYPAQVRSDIKDYLRNFNNKIIIGRAQLDYHFTPIKNNHVMISAGILEEMFSGYGFEYLHFENGKSFAFGFELFNVKKRDYRMKFGSLDYRNLTGSINLYYRNYDWIPFDAKVSYGEYLAGDIGSTFEISRSFRNGGKFGVFASFTDVSSDQFGEGSFDKGLFFTIPVYKNLLNYSWRPLTKDPAAKLSRKHTLHDLLVKFRPYNP